MTHFLNFRGKRTIGVIAGVVLGFSLAITIGLIVGPIDMIAQAQRIPAPIRPCLEGFEKAEVIGEVEADQMRYYLVRTGEQMNAFDALISLNQDVCSLENASKDNTDYPLASYVDQEVAQALSEQRFQHIFKTVGGKDVFERDFLEYASSQEGQLVMPEASYTALKKLGVEIPSNVVASDEPPEVDKAVEIRE